MVHNPQEAELKFFACAMMSWCGIIRRDFLQEHHIRHNETPGAPYQDNGFWFQLMCYAQRVMFIDKSGYYYRRDNPNSSVRSDKLFAINEEYGFIYGFLFSGKDFAKFKGIYWSKKYTNAVFTLHRIGREYRQMYVQHMLEEFRGAENKQELHEACFCQQDWQDLQLLLSDSEAYLQKMVPGKR